MNRYRRAHYFEQNRANTKYRELVSNQIKGRINTPIGVSYLFHTDSKRKIDGGNYTALHEKFFLDALVELDVIPDDDVEHVPIRGKGEWKGLDRGNGRVEILVWEL